ncbi:MAG: UDP-N-acetylmuramoyl-tripeptide--D-alanyl-D-alanine ligase [Burkholderiales bacterium]|nr:MAG: UDP-N-acetylmuramoyl-tripeptide--D-alanyl-D-alanine ligase [Burkholderiales bacterium]
MFSLRQALGWLSTGRLLGAAVAQSSSVLAGVCTDSRALAAGQLFVALRGERFDGHDFVERAIDAGAAAVMVDRPPETIRVPVLLVPDTRVGLGEIAAGWRARFRLPVIAVTGSNGKTTVKDMIAAILAEHYGEAERLATRGNLNNEIGLPLTLFRLDSSHRVAVLELGMNRPGEIAWLAQLARPSIGLVNNAQREHQEFMHTVEAVARENGAVIEALPADGTAVFPADDAFAPLWRELAAGRRRIEFGQREPAAVSAPAQARPEAFELCIDGQRREAQLTIAGRHNVHNALAAAACTHALGVPIDAIVAGLEAFRPAAGRLVRHRLAGGATVIDDSYNANPDSVRAAIELLADAGGRTLLVLGDMGEVGAQGPAFHREVGEHAARCRLSALMTLGAQARLAAEAFGAGASAFDSLEALTEAIGEAVHGPDAPATTVLIKGSRFMRMERLVSALLANEQPAASGAAGVH